MREGTIAIYGNRYGMALPFVVIVAIVCANKNRQIRIGFACLKLSLKELNSLFQNALEKVTLILSGGYNIDKKRSKSYNTADCHKNFLHKHKLAGAA